MSRRAFSSIDDEIRRQRKSAPVEPYPENQLGDAWETPRNGDDESGTANSPNCQDCQEGSKDLWEPILPLWEIPEVKGFPVDVFSGKLKNFVTESAESFPCPPDYIGVISWLFPVLLSGLAGP